VFQRNMLETRYSTDILVPTYQEDHSMNVGLEGITVMTTKIMV
jgi:hypothetical protein